MSTLSERVIESNVPATDISVTIQNIDTPTILVKLEKKKLAERIPAFGLLLALLGVTCFSVEGLIVKLLTDLHSIQILVFRCSIQLIPYLIITMVRGYPFFGPPEHQLDLVLRCVSGSIQMITIYMAYRLIPLSDASTLYMSSPVFVTVFAYILLKESITKIQVITGSITLVGMFIISKPEFIFGEQAGDDIDEIYEDKLLGIILSITAAVTSAFAMIYLRKLRTTQLPVVIMWYSFTVIAMGSILLSFVDDWVMPTDMHTWLLLFGIGGAGILYQFFQTLAFRYEHPGPLSVARCFNIVLSFVFDVMIFTEQVEWTSILGAVLISLCVVIIAVLKWHNEKPQHFYMLLNNVCCITNINKNKAKFIPDLDGSVKSNTLEHMDENANIKTISFIRF